MEVTEYAPPAQETQQSRPELIVESQAPSVEVIHTPELPSAKDLEAYAFDVNSTINRPGWLRSQAIKETKQAYIDDPDFNGPMSDLGTFLLYAKEYHDVHKRMHKTQAQLEYNSSDALRKDLKEDRVHILDYKLALRDWIWSYGSELQPSDMVRWIGDAADDHNWATGMVRGLSGEIAVAKELVAQKAAGTIQDFWFTGIEGDSSGVDMIVAKSGQAGEVEYLGIDVKARDNLPEKADKVIMSRPDKTGLQRAQVTISSREIGRGFALEPGSFTGHLEELTVPKAPVEVEPSSEQHDEPIRLATKYHKPRAHHTLAKPLAEAA